MVVLVGIVIIGGIRRIAATAEKIVPLMCGVYVLAVALHPGGQLHDDPARLRPDLQECLHAATPSTAVSWA